MQIPGYFEDMNHLHVNTEPDRAYYIPASGRGCYFLDREKSDRFFLLSGIWKFEYFESVYDLPENFWNEGVIRGKEAEVPAVWQSYGEDENQYINTRYPFPFDPPFVPRENPCGLYERSFEYKSCPDAPEAFLNFEGVDSCFYVWINGTFVGYSQVSHSTSEFHITRYLKEGDNRLTVLVLKWCDGSYLGDQDKFRMSGIFRDVYVLKHPKEAVRDYFIRPYIQGNSAEISVELSFYGANRPEGLIRVLDPDGEVVLEQNWSRETEEDRICFCLENCRFWNAETPWLYTIELQTEKEWITDRFGVREIYVDNGVLFINKTAVKFHGVNRHDSDPVTGFAINRQQMETDLRLMKEHNVNAIRTSHYQTGIQKELPSVPPHGSAAVQYTGRLPEGGRCFLRVRYLLRYPVSGLKEGWELGFDEAELPEAVSEKTEICGKEKLPETGRAALILDQTERRITVTGKDFTYVYDTFLGVFSEIKKGEKEYLTHPMEYNIWRAPADNDRRIRLEWERAGYDRTRVRTYSTEAHLLKDGSAELVTELSLSAVHIQRILNIKSRWLIHTDGQIRVELNVKKDMEFPFLPRFGLRLFLDKSFCQVRYCGMGPEESYPDKHRASWHGIFEGNVRTMHRPYLKPQEYGAHWDCSWCSLSGEEMGLKVTSGEAFMFQACTYTQEELSGKAHDFELEEADSTILCLDHSQSGIGSGSCGPQLLEKYQFNEPEFSRTWIITPGRTEE